MRETSLSIAVARLLILSLAAVGCSSRAVTQVTAEGGAGDGGASDSSSGTRATGGTAHKGGTTGKGGTQGRGGSGKGGTSNQGGSSSSAIEQGGTTQATSGSTTSGGTAGVGGATGTSSTAVGECSVSADCAGHVNEVYCTTPVCTNGVCTSSPLAAIADATCTGGCSVTPSAGFWGADVPYVLYVPHKGTNTTESMAIQRIKADGSVNGNPATFSLDSDAGKPVRIAAAMSGSTLGVLYGAPKSTGSLNTVRFVTTTLTATNPVFVTMEESTTAAELTFPAKQLYVFPRTAGNWILAGLSGASDYGLWSGTSGPANTTGAFSGLSSLYDDRGAIAVFDDVVMVSGHSNFAFRNGGPVNLMVQRFAAGDLSVLGTATDLGVVDNGGAVGSRPAAMVRLGANLGIMWNTQDSSTAPTVTVHSAILSQGGAIVQAARAAAASTLVVRDLVPTPNGGALLVGSQIDVSGAPTYRYTPVVQLLNEKLEAVGSTVAIGPVSAYDVANVRSSVSPDGKTTLVTFDRQVYSSSGPFAHHKLLDTGLCQ